MYKKFKKRAPASDDDDNGFALWGGYMEAKKAKLEKQFDTATVSNTIKQSNIFADVAIYVNGLTFPTADELKTLMAAHGGVYHHYQSSGRTTHIIASNLPNFKIKQLNINNVPVVKPTWITDSIAANRLLDYKKYLLYTNYNKTQPRLEFVSKQMKSTLTASDPKFLSEFYNNSRLHLISTLGAEFKQFVAQLREKSNQEFPGKKKLLVTLNDRKSFVFHSVVIMHIDMDCFFVSVGMRNRPDLKGKPVAVTHARNTQNGGGNRQNNNRETEIAWYKENFPNDDNTELDLIDKNSSMSEIASCSYEARKCGVRNGMFLGAALKLCPNLKTIPYDFQGYREVSSTLYRTIASYTLDIEAVSCDEMYVDVSQILRETGLTVEEWALHIRGEIMKVTGCPCSTGFGANRLQARLATKKAKPAGQYYLKSDDVEEYMAEISLADLPGVGYATVAKLKNLGLSRCGDVQGLSLTQLQNELGQKGGETLYEQVRGIDNKPLNFHHERKSVSADVNFGIRFQTQEECYNFLQSLSQEVYTRLRDLDRSARCVTLKLMVRAAEAPEETAKYLGHGICDSLSRSKTGPPLNDAGAIYREVKILYERLKVPFRDLRGVGIQLTKLEKAPPINTALKKFLTEASKLEQPSIVISSSKKVEVGVKNVGKQTTTGIEQFFKTEKSQKAFKCKNPTPIDMDVFKELPPDLQQEIVNEYQLDITTKQTSSPPLRKIKTSDNQKHSPFENLSLDELKTMVGQWLRCEDQPIDFDVNMFGNHLKQLALNREIEYLQVALNFLHRQLNNVACGNWHKAYFTIIDLVQEGMVARYGNTLFVNRQFSCCSQ